MSVLDHTVEPVQSGRGRKFRLRLDGAPLSFGDALSGLRDDAALRSRLTALIADREFTALRWETPPVTASTLGRDFEFVLVADPLLDMDAEPDLFRPSFDADAAGRSVLAIPNLGRTAMMVVPRGLGPASHYGHLAAFLRRASSAQVHALWRCVAETALARLGPAPLWISTAGGGVTWLHVRIEGEPKYYDYRPYAHFDGWDRRDPPFVGIPERRPVRARRTGATDLARTVGRRAPSGARRGDAMAGGG